MNRRFLPRLLSTILPSCVITLGVMLALIACSGNLITMARNTDSQTAQGQHTFSVSSRTRPTIFLNGNAAQMNVHVGAVNRVIIQYTVRHSGAGRAATVSYTQNSAANSVSAREIEYPRNGYGNDDLVFSVTVPKNCNLNFTTSSGSMNVSGVNGRIVLSTQSGNLDTTNVLFKDTSTLTTQSGNVSFSGNVQPGSTCKAHTNSGSIDATFPRSARLSVTASLAAGSISSDFSSISIHNNNASGHIGSSPYGFVQLTAQVGSISIHKS